MTEAYWLSMTLNLSDKAPDGPGWYAYVSRDSTLLVTPQRLDSENAVMLGEMFDEILERKNNEVLPSDVVRSGNNLTAQAIKDQLAEAEAHALRIARLRKLKASLPEENPMKENEPS